PKSRESRSTGASLDASVGVTSEATGLARVNRIVGRPRPTPESGATVVRECLLDTGAIVHDERAVLLDRFADGAALQKQALHRSIACRDRHRAIGTQHHGSG